MHRPLLPCLVAAVFAPVLAAQNPSESEQQRTLIRALQDELDAARREIAELRGLLDAPVAAPSERAVRGAVGLDFTTAYWFRGILQENQGVIAEPWAELGWRLLGGDGFVRDVDLTFGTWNSLHDGPTGGSGGVWYESDAYVTLAAKLAQRVAVSTTYTAYHSPNAAFATVQEQSFSIAFDDADLLFPRGLQPSVTFAFELDGQADGGSHEGSYAEIAINPSLDLTKVGDANVVLALPITVGLSMNDYFEQPGGGRDETFGYVDVGLVATTNLPWLPAGAGPWDLSLGLHWLGLGDSNEARHADDSDTWFATIGLRSTF